MKCTKYPVYVNLAKNEIGLHPRAYTIRSFDPNIPGRAMKLIPIQKKVLIDPFQIY